MAKVQPAEGLGDPYKNPELFEWLDSLEGVPDWLGPAETDAERAGWSDWQRAGNRYFALAGATMPGLALALLIAMAGRLLADLPTAALGFDKTPISPILAAILLGLLIRNAIGLPNVYEAGLQLALKRVLRFGVALLGIRLSLYAAGSIGLVALPIVTVCIVTALLFVTRIGRVFGLPARLSTLIAVGTAICGNTAIVAMAPVIQAEDDEVSYAVGCVTLFGLLALIFYPFLSHGLFAGDAHLAGLFLGTAIHDTAQVAGAGLVYLVQYGTPDALDSATVTKLIRNMFMLVVIPVMAYLHQRGGRSIGKATSTRAQIKQAGPTLRFRFPRDEHLEECGRPGRTTLWSLESRSLDHRHRLDDLRGQSMSRSCDGGRWFGYESESTAWPRLEAACCGFRCGGARWRGQLCTHSRFRRMDALIGVRTSDLCESRTNLVDLELANVRNRTCHRFVGEVVGC